MARRESGAEVDRSILDKLPKAKPGTKRRWRDALRDAWMAFRGKTFVTMRGYCFNCKRDFHIEAGRAIPSPKLISAAADFYGDDVFELCVAAGQLPPELTSALKELPASALRRVYYDVMGELELNEDGPDLSEVGL